MSDHGTYARYSNPTRPCRCDACRKAKADYMRERRARARLMAQKHTSANPAGAGARTTGSVRYVAPIARHGTRFGYEEHGCRCFACTEARTSDDYARRARKRAG